MRTLSSLLAAALVLANGACLSAQSPVTAPEDHLGRALAADFTLPDWNAVRGYFEKLDAESPRVVLEKVGRTTEGRDLVLATISSEKNLAELPRLKNYAKLLADPRGANQEARREAVEQGKVFLFISCAMHATECAAPQFAMQLAHELATSDAEPWRSARENLVVLLLPSTNPDGLDHVAEWYAKTVGTPFEASELTKLYQFYVGHDNNRDWFMLTQAETRIVTELLYSQWRPQVYWDVHQQGSRSERMFVPPFRDPLNPNLDPSIIGAINLLGTRAQLDMTRAGKTGVATGGTYDMWWNGGNRNVPVRHNIVGLLTEAASARLASPMFLAKSDLSAPDGVKGYLPSNRFPAPWPGGWWRLADIVDYEMAFASSLAGSLSREREFFLRNALEAADRAMAAGKDGAPSAWLVPSDNRDRGASRRLAEILIATGVELAVADGEITADGRTYPRGTIVIRRDQPYGSHVKDLLDVQRYPQGEPPYDVAGWTLPFLLGVRRVEVIGEISGATRAARSAEDAVAGFAGDGRIQPAGSQPSTPKMDSARDADGWKNVFARLRAKEKLSFVTHGEGAGCFRSSDTAKDGEEPSDTFTIDGLPRIGLYAPWTGSMDEGWMRWVLDTSGVAYVTVRNEMLRAGDLHAFLDVLVIPSVDAGTLDRGRAPGSVFDEYAGGLDPEGAIAVEEFVRGGGSLVAIGGASKWAIDLLRLPVVDATAGEAAKEFSCPGSVLRAIPVAGSRFTADLDESLAVFFSGSLAFRESTEKEREELGLAKGEKKVEALLRYAPTRLLLSGWIQKPEVIADKIAWARVEHGKGAVHLFGFRPQYRGWTQGVFQLLFRAMLLEARRS